MFSFCKRLKLQTHNRERLLFDERCDGLENPKHIVDLNGTMGHWRKQSFKIVALCTARTC